MNEIHFPSSSMLPPLEPRGQALRGVIVSIGTVATASFLLSFLSKPLAIGFIATSGVLSLGAAAVIAHIVKNPSYGLFWGGEHWKPVILLSQEGEKKFVRAGYLDNSDTSKSIQGLPIYEVKKLVANEVLVQGVFMCAFPRAILAKQLSALFYGVALMYAALYALIDSRNGGKLIAKLESEMNDHVPLHKSIWLCKFLLDNKEESYQRLRQGGGLYIAGCMQPFAYLGPNKCVGNTYHTGEEIHYTVTLQS